MQSRNSIDNFGFIAIALHWVMAFFIIGMLIIGLYMVGLPISLQKLKLYGLHKAFGVLILMLAILRITWRFSNITPALILPWWEKLAARILHWLFYGFMFALPATGWIMSSAAGLPVSFFGFFTLPDLVSPNPQLMKLLSEIHKYLAFSLIAAIAGHVCATLKHHFIDKNDILKRML